MKFFEHGAALPDLPLRQHFTRELNDIVAVSWHG
ncbi:hypothetical protein IL54_2552 [Sphingobium sp. ba1]|nr:hypothetical protein IL54_2552 [Sphingobium sp. ba1]